ncbi:ABC transporter ATP-binding protein [uncultured Megasphaera sp.]|uniref:ABC transporter ATP-binding protein n=1 Tax=uncultured Megasphaera sp. TaxID=165188 RepID=UPI0025DBCF14|nr:ABC transporter ATP-binding protein [uncultured Megasphaera sp.]
MRSIFFETIKKNGLLLAVLVLAIIASIAVSIAPPLILQYIVDSLANGTFNAWPLLTAGVLYFALNAGSGLVDALKETLITIFGQKITHGLRTAMCRRLDELSASYFVSHEAGAVTSLFVNDVDTLEDLFDSGVVSMIADTFTIISILAVVFHLSPGLGILLCLALPLLFLLTRYFQKRMLKAQKDNRIAVSKTNELIPETVHNIRTIHTCQEESFLCWRYGRTIRASFEAMERSNFCDSIYSPIIITSCTLIICTMMALSVSTPSLQELFGMSVGSVVALIGYVRRIFSPLESIGMEIQSIQSAVAGISRLKDFFAEPVEKDFFPEEPDWTAVPLVIDDVSFGYGREKNLFQHFSLTVGRGEMVTVTGRTGAGKSTLFKLILGLYRPRQGQVRIFGADPCRLSPAQRRRVFGYVEQQFHAVSGSVGDQVSLKDPRITTQDIEKALRLVGLWDLCLALPQGLATPYRPELFSRGQSQLLSIARAVVMDPQLLLLDEITANLDSLTEAQVLDALQAAAAHRTVLSISHRFYEARGGRVISFGKNSL